MRCIIAHENYLNIDYIECLLCVIFTIYCFTKTLDEALFHDLSHLYNYNQITENETYNNQVKKEHKNSINALIKGLSKEIHFNKKPYVLRFLKAFYNKKFQNYE